MTIAEALKQEGIQEGIQKGKLEGIQEGIQKGLEKGRREGIIAVAKNMLDSGTSQTLIKQVTGLTDSELNNLKN